MIAVNFCGNKNSIYFTVYCEDGFVGSNGIVNRQKRLFFNLHNYITVMATRKLALNYSVATIFIFSCINPFTFSIFVSTPFKMSCQSGPT